MPVPLVRRLEVVRRLRIFPRRVVEQPHAFVARCGGGRSDGIAAVKEAVKYQWLQTHVKNSGKGGGHRAAGQPVLGKPRKTGTG